MKSKVGFFRSKLKGDNSDSLSLNSFQTIILVGLITGCMLCSFVFGFMSGKKVGFDTALEATLSSAGKLPINEPVDFGDLGDEAESSMYASLKQDDDQVIVSELSGESISLVEQVKVNIDTSAEEDALNLEKKIDDIISVEKEDVPEVSSVRASLSIENLDKKIADTNIDALNEEIVIKEEKIIQKVDEPIETEVSKVVVDAPLIVEKEESLPNIKIESGWYAQVATPTKLSEANLLVSKLKRNGFRSNVQVANIASRKYYRVLVGSEQTKEQGKILVDQLAREPYISGKPFLKLIE